MNSKLSVSILIVTILSLSTLPTIECLRCYACTYTTSSGEPECIDSPSSLPGQNIVTCSKKYCVILRQELIDPSGKVNSFSRGCEESPLFLNDVIEDSTFKSYYRSCTTDLCNSGDGLRSGSLVSSDGGAGDNILVVGLPGNAVSVKYSITLIFIGVLVLKIFNC